MSASQSTIPSARVFQFDQTTIGNLEKNVNLFKGDVQISLDLIRLPGRIGRNYLDVNLSISYQSNTIDMVTRTNTHHPTGILGTGWSMPSQSIVLNNTKHLSKWDRSYTLNASDGGGLLVLTKTQGKKEYYQTENYKFWVIIYDPEKEEWEITKENGVRWTFGGQVTETDKGYKESKGNSITWGVKYDNWIGNSSLTDKKNTAQQQYAKSWHLVEIKDNWGDSVRYGYNEFKRTEQGLLKDVEQFVGDANGLPYTKASYLTSITDVFGRQLTFTYSDKVYDSSKKEYQRAHDQNTSGAEQLNGYQDFYETKYLENIKIVRTDKSIASQLNFEYHDLINLTDTSAAKDPMLASQTFKRFLKSVTKVNHEMMVSPNIVFDYYWDRANDQSIANSGALRTIVYPEGSTTTYTYKEQKLTNCKRDLICKLPAEVAGYKRTKPYVWFGSDYAVVVWHGFTVNGGSIAWMTIYNWLGYWKEQTSISKVLHTTDNSLIDFANFNVILSEKSFALHFEVGNSTRIYGYTKDQNKAGEWISYENTSSNVKTNFIEVNATGDDIHLTVGHAFVVVQYKYTTVKGEAEFNLVRTTWDWRTLKWTTFSTIQKSKLPLKITGGGEYYITLQYNSQQEKTVLLELNALGRDENGNQKWLQSSGGKLSLNVNPKSDHHDIYLRSSESMAVMTVIKFDDNATTNFSVTPLLWDGDYQFSLPNLIDKEGQTFHQSFTQNKKNNYPPKSTVIATIQNNCTISAGYYCLRYNGRNWLINDNLKPVYTKNDSTQSFVQDHDYKLLSESYSLGTNVGAISYNANELNQINRWNSPLVNLKLEQAKDANEKYPISSGGEDYFMVGRTLFYRGASTSWPIVDESGIYTINDSFDAQTILNMAPSFIAYQKRELVIKNSTLKILNIRNGKVGSEEIIFGHAYPSGNTTQQAFGSNTLLSFPLSDTVNKFESTKEFTLYRFVGDSLQGELIHYPVEQISVEDGFGRSYHATYAFDADSAACDANGAHVKYYKSVIYHGSKNKEVAGFGYTENVYLNGFNNRKEIQYHLNGESRKGNLSYPQIDGLQLSTIDYNNDQQEIKKVEYEWEVFTQKSSHPNKSDSTLEHLYGNFVVPKKTTTTLDGISTTEENQYIPESLQAPFSGQVILNKNTSYNGNGKLETYCTQLTYAYDKYSKILPFNALTAIVQNTMTLTVEGNPVTTTVGATATTLKDFGNNRWAIYQNFSWLGEMSSNFSFPIDQSTPKGWLKTKQINLLSEKGLTVESENSAGVKSSMIYDKNEHYPLANIENASSENHEVDYYGFEDYETGNGWMLNSKCTRVEDPVLTGFKSLQLGKGAEFSKSYRPINQQCLYVFGYWYKTSDDYKANDSNGWTANLGADPIFKPFENTHNEWRFDFLLANFKSDPGTVTLSVRASNTGEQAICIDNIRFCPDQANFTATVYDQLFDLEIAMLSKGDGIARKIYDNFKTHTASVGPYREMLTTLTEKYLSRHGNQGKFSKSDPNQLIQVRALEGGHWQSFSDGDSWQKKWKVTHLNTNWKRENGILKHTNEQVSDSLELVDKITSSGLAFSGEIRSAEGTRQLKLSDAIGIQIGNDTQFKLFQNRWDITIDKQKITPRASGNDEIQTWIVVLRAKNLFFYVNGQLIYSGGIKATEGLTLSLLTGKNKIGFRNLMVANKPQLAVTFEDAIGNTIQNQTLLDDNCLVNGRIYDDMGNNSVSTKSAPAWFGKSGKETPLLVYRPNFIDVDDFLRHLDSTGEMKGEVANYYDGVNNPSNDQKYPYTRYRFAADPLQRVEEIGKPGKEFAIINPFHTEANSRHTVKFAYSANGQSTKNFPQEKYRFQQITDENQVVSYRLLNMNGEVVLKATQTGQKQLNEPKSSSEHLSKMNTQYSAKGRVETLYLPNYFDEIIKGHEDFVITKTYDVQGNLIANRYPGKGRKAFVYDQDAHLRFYQDDEGASAGYFSYVKYNELGKAVEKGILHAQFDQAALSAHADNRFWPTSEAKQEIQQTCTYFTHKDGLLGMDQVKTMCTYFTHNDDITTTYESFSYDALGALASRKVRIEQNGNLLNESEIVYQNSESGKLQTVFYPVGNQSGLSQVVYTYDNQDRVTMIGKSADEPDSFARYVYDENGQHHTKLLNKGTIKTSFDYTSRGWIHHSATANNGQTYGQDFEGYSPSGNITSFKDRFGPIDQKEEFHCQLGYDDFNQMVTADYTSFPKRNMVIGAFDPNGNILKIRADGQDLVYEHNPGTDQINQVRAANTVITGLRYNKTGEVLDVDQGDKSLHFTYRKGTSIVDQITFSQQDDSVLFAYSGDGQRVLKQPRHGKTVENQKIYVYGHHDLPLVEISVESTTAFIYGPNGLVAFLKNGKTYFVLQDHQSSNRMVLDATNNVQANYAFDSFGSIESNEKEKGLLTYLYTGQEWDEELGLHNFKTRFYNSQFKHFYSPDPANQYSSAYAFCGNNPINFVDPSGMSFWSTLGDICTEIVQVQIAVGEIIAGVAIDVASGGAAEAAGGALIGAGTTSAQGIVSANIHGHLESWSDFGKDQVTGAIVGAITAGIGTATSSVIESNAMKGGSKIAVTITGAAVGGGASAMAGQMASNGLSGKSAFSGVGSAGLKGAASGAASGAWESRNHKKTSSQMLVKSQKSLGYGIEGATKLVATDICKGVGKSAASYIAGWAISPDHKWDWTDFGSEVAQGVIDGAVAGALDLNTPRKMQNSGVTFPIPATNEVQMEMMDLSCSPHRLDRD